MDFKEKFEKARKYWQGKFYDEISEIDLPCDFERSTDYKKDNYEITFPGELSGKLLALSKDQDALLYVVLLAALKVLIFKYTGKNDVSVGAPVYTDSADGKDYGGEKMIVFRDILANETTFKDLLIKVKQTVIEGYENQYYVKENILDVLGVTIPLRQLSRLIFLLENIHQRGVIRDIIDSPANDLTISLLRTPAGLTGNIQYNAKLFREDTIKNICSCYLYILEQVLADINIKLAGIGLLSEEEKKRVIYDFNGMEAGFPGTKTIHRLFEEQAAKTPLHTAVVFEDERLTYRQLNEKTNRLAGTLLSRGVTGNHIIGLMMESSLAAVVGIMAVLKVGAAYLPLDPQYPAERKKYILQDSSTNLLIIQEHLLDDNKNLLEPMALEHLPVTDETAAGGETANPGIYDNPVEPAYVIYTSGSTGRPKGTLVEHRGIVNYTWWRLKTYNYTENDVTLQMLSYSFDGFGSNFYSSLLSGGALLMVPDRLKLDFSYITGIVRQHRVTNMSLVPAMYRMFLDNAGKEVLKSLRLIVLAGEKSKSGTVKMSKEKVPGALLVNEYGPTETSVTAVAHPGMNETGTAVIGRPIANARVYVLDTFLKPLPVNVTGELCVAGTGVARGYMNNPELTDEKFLENPFAGGERLYRTGDLARWLPGGNLELSGRIDHQVKIRGFRIELTEIENCFMTHDQIKEAVVTANGRDNHLCAYIVSASSIDVPELREYLSARLPGYMMPSYFVPMEKIPLNPNGKVDRRALPLPELKSAEEYVAPRNRVEETLAGIWAEVLEIETDIIGIDSNFFELGGHSLRATLLVSKIHKTLNVTVSLPEIFKKPTIRYLAELVKGAEEDRYVSIKPAEKKEYYPLSSAQKRLYILQQVDPESTAYNLPQLLQVDSKSDRAALEECFKKLIRRHESLRTSFEMLDGEPVQKVHTEVAFEIQCHEVGDRAQHLIDRFIRPFDLSRAPILQVSLVKTADNINLLMLDVHHIAADGFSFDILLQEFSALFQGQELPPSKLQYKDFSEWENRLAKSGQLKKQEDYWLNVFGDRVPVLNMPTDYPRPEMQSFEGEKHFFKIDGQLTGKIKEIVSETGTTLHIVLLAAYSILLAKYTGQEDIVVGSPIAGRTHADLQNIVGMFVNMLAIRNKPGGNKTFMEFLQEVKENALNAYDNQDYQFDSLVEKLAVSGDRGRNPLVEAVFLLQNLHTDRDRDTDADTESQPRQSSGPRDSQSQPQSYDFDRKISKFDLKLAAIEEKDGLNFSVEYYVKLFKGETIEKMGKHFVNLLEEITTNPGIKISKIKMLSKGEKEQLINKIKGSSERNPDQQQQYKGKNGKVEGEFDL